MYRSGDGVLTKLIAHRGLPSRYPENTLIGLDAACAIGARFIEFDIRFTADRVPVLLHDATLERTTGTTGNVEQWTWSRLRNLTAGEPSRFGDQFADVRLTRLVEVAWLLERNPDVTCFIDIKDDGVAMHGPLVVLDSIVSTFGNLVSQAVITCARPDMLITARDHGMPTALVLGSLDNDQQTSAMRLSPDYIFCDLAHLDSTDMSLWRGRWQWAVYGVETPADADRMTVAGVHYLETKSYDVLARRPADQLQRASEQPGD